MKNTLLTAAVLSVSAALSARATTVTINLGDTRYLSTPNADITADTIINNGTIIGQNNYVYLNAPTSLTNNGTIESDSAAMRLVTPTIVHNGLMTSVGPAATIDLNYGGTTTQTITGTGRWNIDNGMNAYGPYAISTTGEFYAQPNSVIAIGQPVATGSSFSMSNLGGGAGGFFVTAPSSTLTILNGDSTKPYAGNISGGATLIKTGTGTQILTGDNTYTGGTQVNAGVLQVNNSSDAAGYGNVDVNSTGTLAGAGNIDTFAIVHSAGKLAPGTSSSNATLSFFGLRLLTGSSLDLDLASTGPSDLIDIYSSGTDVAGTTVNITDTGLTPGSTVWFFQYENTLIVDSNNVPTGGSITTSDFTLGTLSPGLSGYLTSESSNNGLDSGRVGFVVTSVPEPTSLLACLFAFPLLTRRRNRSIPQ